MGLKPQYGGWAVVGLVIALVIIVAGAVLTLCRRHLDWQWGRRNVWSICEEWRQRLSWLWAPREEKVGLVKAQHPTAQTVPGLYRQTGNTSQNLLHSDSDLRLDAQGAFTRFEAVDRDLHPPLGSTNAIPPQPLRPAPQPKPTGRPRPSPLSAACGPASDYLRMHEAGLGPLTPPPMQPVPRSFSGPVAARPTPAGRCGGSTLFIFQQPDENDQTPTGDSSGESDDRAKCRGSILDSDSQSISMSEKSRGMTHYAIANGKQSSMELLPRVSANFESRYEEANHDPREGYDTIGPRQGIADGALIYGQYEIIGQQDLSGGGMRYALSSVRRSIDEQQSPAGPLDGNDLDPTIDSTAAFRDMEEIDQFRQRMRKESRGSVQSGSLDLYNCGGSSTAAHRTIMESIYGPPPPQPILNKFVHHQNSVNWSNDGMLPHHPWNSHRESQSIEMTAYLDQTSGNFDENGKQPLAEVIPRGNSTEALQGLQTRVSQYIETLPDLPVDAYDRMQADGAESVIHREDGENAIFRRDQHAVASGPVPPPPAPPDLTGDLGDRQNSVAPTTGERIFSALRSVTSQSYIDASEFYNSVLSSAQQQVPRFTFPTITRSSLSLDADGTRLRQADAANFYAEPDQDATVGPDGVRRASDLYSPELNLEAHRTAQEVYNSLQDPPASPLLLRDLSQEPYPYMSDPSFTRTSEDIYNSIEQRRKSMERLNGLHETYMELEASDSTRRKSSQDLYAALEEVQLKRRLSQKNVFVFQNLEESYGGWMGGLELGENTSLMNRRGSQGTESEPPPDETNLKRAVSCESVCSDTSVSLGDLMEDVTVVGHVCVGLEHERWGGRGADCEGDLAVSVLEARDLVAPDGRPAQDTLARVCLLPDRQTHVQTRLYRGSPSPSYQEKFLFPLDGGPIGRTLLVEIFSVEMTIGGGASLVGEATLKLGSAARPPATTWLPLVSPALPFPHLGELMFSLSYLPTAERLTLVVVKARNLHGANPPLPGDFFVKVYLLQQGKKMHKKKTSAKRGEKSPIFNEAIIFSVPPHALQTIQLRLTVAEIDPAASSKAFSVGHIIVGSTAAGKSLAHWRHMLAALRRPVAMWHPLRK